MPFAPTDIANLVLWLKADGTKWQDSARTTSATADGDPVGAWDDESGNSSHVLQGTSGYRPTLKTGLINSLPAIRFDGYDDIMSASISTGTDVSVFSVFEWKRGAYSTIDTIAGADGSWLFYPTNSFISGSDTAASLEEVGFGGVDPWVNGVSDSPPGNWPTSGYACFAGVIGSLPGGTNIQLGRYAGTSYFGQNDIAELIVYDAGLSDANRILVQDYLSNKYDLGFATQTGRILGMRGGMHTLSGGLA